MSDIDDHFPPNRWAKNFFLFKTPLRFTITVITIVVLMCVLPPNLVAPLALIGVWVCMATSVVLMIWYVIWWKKHPLAPAEYCDKCGHMLPRKFKDQS